MGKFIGGRIVPKHCGVWNETEEYEVLSIVLEEGTGDSYISRRAVPAGTGLQQSDYWAMCSRFSEQMKLLEDGVAASVVKMHEDVGATKSAMSKELAETENRVTEQVNAAEKSMQQTEAAMNEVVEQLNTRLDANVAASTDADADYAAEVVDARVDELGNTHASLGTAIRSMTGRIAQKQDETCDVLGDKLDKIVGKNLFDKTKAARGYYLNQHGVLQEHEEYCVSDFIKIKPNTTYTVYPINEGGAYQCYYDESKNILSSAQYLSGIVTDGKCNFTSDEDTHYVRVCMLIRTIDQCQVEAGSTPTQYAEYTEFAPIELFSEKLEGMAEQVVLLDGAVSKAEEMGVLELKLERRAPKNNWNEAALVHGKYMNAAGGVQLNASYDYCDTFIPVKEGQIVIASACVSANATRSVVDMRFVVAFDSARQTVEESGINTFTKSYTVPQGISFVKVTIRNSYLDIMVEVTDDGVMSDTYEKYFEEHTTVHGFNELKEQVGNAIVTTETELNLVRSATINGTGLYQSAAEIQDGGLLELESNCIKKNKHLSFSSDISTFGKITVGHGLASYNGNYVTIDAENLYVYSYSSVRNLVGTYAHGLKVEKFIRVLIDVDNTARARVVVFSASGSYTLPSLGWTGSNGTVFVKSEGSVLTNVKLSWTSDDYRKPIWAFGDSYFSMGSSSRWPYYMQLWGYDNWLCDAYSGRKSETALKHLITNLTHGTPRYILWCMGMNDADSATAINASWLNTLNHVADICDSKGIELILCTLPNVSGGVSETEPTKPLAIRNHAFKNAYVISSGYRYIDFASAVGADNNGFWYDEMLYSDGVHPASLGAQALAMQVLIDFPEIMQK